MQKSLKAIVMSAVLLLTVTAFGTQTSTDTLFQRLGGMKTIKAVVDQFVTNCVNDDKVAPYFLKTGVTKNPMQLARFKKNLASQICEAAGGPCKYKGKDMRTAHKGMKITDEAFNALVADLTAALDKFNVKADDKAALIGVLGPMKGAIVEKGEHRAAN